MRKVFITQSKPNILNHGKKLFCQIHHPLSTQHAAQTVGCFCLVPWVCTRIYTEIGTRSVFIFIDLTSFFLSLLFFFISWSKLGVESNYLSDMDAVFRKARRKKAQSGVFVERMWTLWSSLGTDSCACPFSFSVLFCSQSFGWSGHWENRRQIFSSRRNSSAWFLRDTLTSNCLLSERANSVGVLGTLALCPLSR